MGTTATVNEPKSSGTPTPESPEQKKEGETKGGVFEIVKAPFNFAWESVLKPAWDGLKYVGGAIKASVVNIYEREKALFTAMGGSQYVLNRVGKIAFMVIKLAIAVLVVDAILTFAGISLFDPMTLLVLLGVAVAAAACASYLAQKKMGEVTMRQTGTHIIEQFAAA